jgi:hypothetical protein
MMKKPIKEVSSLQPVVPGTEFLSTFVPVPKNTDPLIKGNRLPAHLDIFPPAYAYSNVSFVSLATDVARENLLGSPQFQAIQLRFSDQAQSLLAIPVIKYDPLDPEQYQVSWANDQTEMRIDLAPALADRQWYTPPGMIRRTPVSILRNIPDVGWALMIDLGNGVLREDPKERRKAKKRQAKEKAKQDSSGQGAKPVDQSAGESAGQAPGQPAEKAAG